MSRDALSYVGRTCRDVEKYPQLRTLHVAILNLLAWRHDEDRHYAWPSITNIALEARCTRRSVFNALDELVQWGILHRAYGDSPAGVERNLYRFPEIDQIPDEADPRYAEVVKEIHQNGRSSDLDSPPVVNDVHHPTSIERIDKRVSSAHTRAKGEPFLTDEQRSKIHTDYDQKLGGYATVEEIIALALDHEAAKKHHRWDLYVRNWLRRDAERHRPGSNGRYQKPDFNDPSVADHIDPGADPHVNRTLRRDPEYVARWNREHPDKFYDPAKEPIRG